MKVILEYAGPGNLWDVFVDDHYVETVPYRQAFSWTTMAQDLTADFLSDYLSTDEVEVTWLSIDKITLRRG